MATKNFRSTVLEPTSEFAHGDKLRFTALATVGEVLKGSFSETTIGEDGVYSVDLQYGKHRIDYKPYEGVWRHFADVEVNADTLATTLQDLALASVPVTDEAVLVLQGILADAEAAKAESATLRDEAAASAAAAEAAAEGATSSINNTSFVHRYAFAASQMAGAGSNGMHTLVKLDEQSGGLYDFIELPLMTLSLSANAIVGSAAVIPLTQRITSLGARSCLYAQAGNGDVRVLYGKPAGEDTYNLYIASRSTQDNNASMAIFVSTNKKMINSSVVGAVTLTEWLAENTGVVELTKIQMGS